MTKTSYDDMMRVVRFLDKSGERTLFPSLLDELGLPCTGDYICSLKKRLAEAGFYKANRHYQAGIEYQTLRKISDSHELVCSDDWANDLRVTLMLKKLDTFTTSDILSKLPISKGQLSTILAKMVRDGEIKIISDSKVKTYQRIEKEVPEEDFLKAYISSLHNPRFLYGGSSNLPENKESNYTTHNVYKSLTDIENQYSLNRETQHTENNTSDIDMKNIVSSITDDRYDNELQDEIFSLKEKYHNQIGNQQFRKKYSKKALDLFCGKQDVAIEKEYQDKVDFINTTYREKFNTTFFDLRFRFNYKYKITEKQCSITKSTRMTHPKWWRLRNKEKVRNAKVYDCVFIQDLMKHYLGNYHEFDIKSAVPRINAEMNGIHYEREVDIYKKIIENAIANDASWAFCLEDYQHYRAQIKQLFMVFYFTGNLPNKVRYSTVEKENAKQEKKAAIIRALADNEEVADELIATEVKLFDDKIITLLKSLNSCTAFSSAIATVIGPAYHKVIFYIESLIELDTVHFFVSQGKMVINNYDGFFFEESIAVSDFQDILDGFIAKHTMKYRASEPCKKFAPRNIEKQMLYMLNEKPRRKSKKAMTA